MTLRKESVKESQVIGVLCCDASQEPGIAIVELICILTASHAAASAEHTQAGPSTGINTPVNQDCF